MGLAKCELFSLAQGKYIGNSSWGVAKTQFGLNKAEVYMNCCKWTEKRKSHLIIIVANYNSPTAITPTTKED